MITFLIRHEGLSAFTLAALATILIALFFDIPYEGDALGYYQGAENLSRHLVFSVDESDPPSPDMIREPGWIALLGGSFLILGTGEPQTVLIMAVLRGLIALGVLRLGSRISPWAGRLAAALVTVDPGVTEMCAVPFSEPLAAALSLWLVLVLLRFSDSSLSVTSPLLIVAGLLAGALVLTRASQGIVLTGVMVPVILWARHGRTSLRPMAMLALLTILLVTPWIARNYQTFGRPQIAWSGGAIFLDYRTQLAASTRLTEVWKFPVFQGHHALALSLVGDSRDCYLFGRFRNEMCGWPLFNEIETKAIAEVPDFSRHVDEITSPYRGPGALSRAMATFSSKPDALFQHIALTVAVLPVVALFDSSSFWTRAPGRFTEIPQAARFIVRMIGRWIWGPVLMVMALLAVRSKWRSSEVRIIALAGLLWILPLVGLALPDGRYLFGMVPFVMVLAAAGVQHVINQGWRKGLR